MDEALQLVDSKTLDTGVVYLELKRAAIAYSPPHTLGSPRQPPQGGRLHQRAVPLRLRQHPKPGRLRRGLRALLRARVGQSSVGRTAGQLHARSPGHLRELRSTDDRTLSFRIGAPGIRRVLGEVHVRAAANHDHRHRRATNDLRRVRAEEEPLYRSEPARAYHEHFAFLPAK